MAGIVLLSVILPMIIFTLSILGKVLDDILKYFFSYFSQKTGFTFQANCHRWIQFAYKVKSCFLWKKIRKISSICHLLSLPREW